MNYKIIIALILLIGFTIGAPNYGNLPIANQTDYQNKLERFTTAFSQEISLAEWDIKKTIGVDKLG